MDEVEECTAALGEVGCRARSCTRVGRAVSAEKDDSRKDVLLRHHAVSVPQLDGSDQCRMAVLWVFHGGRFVTMKFSFDE